MDSNAPRRGLVALGRLAPKEAASWSGGEIDAVEQIGGRYPERRGELEDGGEAYLAGAALDPTDLDWCEGGGVGEIFLRPVDLLAGSEDSLAELLGFWALLLHRAESGSKTPDPRSGTTQGSSIGLRGRSPSV